jgi:hypothetical protein
MKRFKNVLILLLFSIVLTAGSAVATTINPLGGGNGSEKNLQTILDDITVGGTSSINVYTDHLPDVYDSLWNTGAVGQSAATFIIEIAGYAQYNQMGVYDSSNSMNRVVLFNGAATAGSRTTLSFFADGTVKAIDTVNGGIISQGVFASKTFGFYFINQPGQVFYSDTSKNTDAFDHLVAFQGTGDMVQLPNSNPNEWLNTEYILAWEDLYGGGDYDFNDMVIMVESIKPVPEPSTVILLGAGLVGAAVYRRRRKLF